VLGIRKSWSACPIADVEPDGDQILEETGVERGIIVSRVPTMTLAGGENGKVNVGD
jgi:hypothetical protein